MASEAFAVIATELTIAIIPVTVIYDPFSEKLIRGMTAGAVK
jgi:ABC-type glycerol-3-phosphate transport system permease component